MQCPKCNTLLPAGANFCSECGKQLRAGYFCFINPQEKEQESNKIVFNVNGIAFIMLKVAGGIFMMGATSEQDKFAKDREKPIHQVEVSDFLIGETLVTQELWKSVMGNNPSRYKGKQRPVEQVTWDNCQEFISRLNVITGKKFRLPTEAEWEFAARGGNKSLGFLYSGSHHPNDVAWFSDNTKTSQPVKTKLPNELGIYDLSGNLLEWCNDWYDCYSQYKQINPKGPNKGVYKVYRGGSWYNDSTYCRISFRGAIQPNQDADNLGFRLALDV